MEHGSIDVILCLLGKGGEFTFYLFPHRRLLGVYCAKVRRNGDEADEGLEVPPVISSIQI